MNLELLARASDTCLTCDKHKQIGLLTCWECFNVSSHPYKSFAHTEQEYLALELATLTTQ